MNFLAIFQRLRQMVVDIWQRTEKRDRNRFFVISGASLAVILIALVMLTRTTYVTLAPGSQLDPSATAEITAALTSLGINYRTDAAGSILVPEKSRVEASNYLTVNGIPNTLRRNPDLYALGTGLTSNSTAQEQYRLYQAEQYIELSIRSIAGIRNAIVQIPHTPQRGPILSSERIKQTASVHLITEEGDRPTQSVVDSVKAITAAAVAGLEPENVAVTCDAGLLLDDPDDIYGRLAYDRRALEQQIGLEYEQSVEYIMELWAGRDAFRVAASVELDFDVEVIDSIEFLPSVDESGIVESSQTIHELAEGFGTIGGVPGMDDNGGGDGYTEIDENNRSFYEKNTEIYNYRISETRRHFEKAQGMIRNLSMTVMISNKVPGANDASFINSLRAAIANAIGLTASQYDRITILFAEFAALEAALEAREAAVAEQRRKEMMELVRILVLYSIVGVCVILLIVKTYGLLKKEPTEEELLAGAIGEGYDPELDEVAALVEMATLGEITEAPKSPFREQLEKFIDKNPSAVADLLRNWLNEEF